MRVLVTGSRTWDDRAAIAVAFNLIEDDDVTLVHGTAKGADTLAESVARSRGWKIERHPAQWNTHTDRCPDWHLELERCRMAGHRRNAEMVDSGADVCFAFIKDGSPGATACALLADNAGIKTMIWRL